MNATPASSDERQVDGPAGGTDTVRALVGIGPRRLGVAQAVFDIRCREQLGVLADPE